MMLFLIVILISINLSIQDCIIDNRTPQDAWEHQLQRDIVKKPGINDIPCGHRGVEVLVRFVLKHFNFDTNEELFEIFSWVFLSWDHDKITWNPDDYGGLNESLVRRHDMWYPQLKLFNGLASEEFEHYFSEPCQVRSNGHVQCVYRVVDRAICVADLTDWPYDTQSCSVKFGVIQKRNNTVRLTVRERAIRMIGADYGVEWDIIDYKQEENQGAEIQLTMTFVIERHAESLAALLVYPSIVLTTLAISSFTLDVRRIIRFALICFNLGNHFYFLTEIQEDIPRHSFHTPRILYYYRGSMITNMFICLLTYGLGVMCKRNKVPPFWISYINDMVFKSRGKLLIWPKWDVEEGTNEFTEQWTNFANIINNVFFVVIIIVYICLYAIFMPQPPPLNY